MQQAPHTFGPGSRLGILGGGQLARMIALSAAELAISCHIFTPEAHSPAGDVAVQVTVANYDDQLGLVKFARNVDLVTYEFENVPAATATILAALRPLHPNANALKTTQDRLLEKNFVTQLGLPVAEGRHAGRPCSRRAKARHPMHSEDTSLRI